MALRTWRISSPERIWAMAIALICMTFLIGLLIVSKWFDTTWTDTKTVEHVQKKPAVAMTITPTKKPVATIKVAPKPVVVSTKKSRVIKEVSASQTSTRPQTLHGYFVQLGAFRHQQHALKFQAQLMAKKIPTTVYDKKGLHAVLAGPYTTHTAAKKAKQSFTASHHLEGFVTHR